uniref:Uncharacterized protein n=1 Tax=Trichuris muris TaxID=70415 RepID=A0A5S6QM90_TRIMR
MRLEFLPPRQFSAIKHFRGKVSWPNMKMRAENNDLLFFFFLFAKRLRRIPIGAILKQGGESLMHDFVEL